MSNKYLNNKTTSSRNLTVKSYFFKSNKKHSIPQENFNLKSQETASVDNLHKFKPHKAKFLRQFSDNQDQLNTKKSFFNYTFENFEKLKTTMSKTNNKSLNGGKFISYLNLGPETENNANNRLPNSPKPIRAQKLDNNIYKQSISLQSSENLNRMNLDTNNLCLRDNNLSASFGNGSAKPVNNRVIKPYQTTSSGYYINDLEAKAELYNKLRLLTQDEIIGLQERGYSLLLDQVELKKSNLTLLQAEIIKLNQFLIEKNNPVRSTHEIELLRGEIRSLTNEKAKLELKIRQKSNWECSKCTYSNTSDAIACIICSAERVDDEIFICTHCSTKNPLINLSCLNCNAYFAESSTIPNRRYSISLREHHNSSCTNLPNLNISRQMPHSTSSSSLLDPHL